MENPSGFEWTQEKKGNIWIIKADRWHIYSETVE